MEKEKENEWVTNTIRKCAVIIFLYISIFLGPIYTRAYIHECTHAHKKWGHNIPHASEGNHKS